MPATFAARFRPMLECLESREVPSASTGAAPPANFGATAAQLQSAQIQVIHVNYNDLFNNDALAAEKVIVRNDVAGSVRVIETPTNQGQLTTSDMKPDLEKASSPVTLAPKTTEPAKGGPVRTPPGLQERDLLFQSAAIKGFSEVWSFLRSEYPKYFREVRPDGST
jgi:hypothetical protein